MDQGHGLLDRFVFWFPVCLRPSPQETATAQEVLGDLPLKSFTDIFLEMYSLHSTRKVFSFTQPKQKMMDTLQGEFISELNESTTEGIPPPKSKRVDLVQRVTVSMHILTHVVSHLIWGRKPRPPPKEISLETLKKSILLLEYAESQKQIIIDVSKLISIDDFKNPLILTIKTQFKLIGFNIPNVYIFYTTEIALY